jgi:hypothetical protein
MLTRFATSLPLGRVDAMFARSLAWLSPRVGGHACVPDCSTQHTCGSCYCAQCSFPCNNAGTRWCDSCGPGDFCRCDCHNCNC